MTRTQTEILLVEDSIEDVALTLTALDDLR